MGLLASDGREDERRPWHTSPCPLLRNRHELSGDSVAAKPSKTGTIRRVNGLSIAFAASVLGMLAMAAQCGNDEGEGGTGTAGALGGPTAGAHADLRDSDATESRFGFELFNLCIHFDEAVP
jgi:hypothetical protein